MLTFGITLMVASIVVGILALTSAALMASPARSAGRRAGRRARTLMARRHGPSGRAAAGEREPHPRAERGAAAYASDEDPPRWLLVLTMISGAGLLLGLLMVMIASIL